MSDALRLHGIRKTFGSAVAVAHPPDWHVWVTIVIGIAGVAGAVWCAAKVFTIGLLMYGKPPDFKTLIRWIRAA